jgi:hypothetical protein
MKRNKPRLTLDRPATYQIKIPGALDALWFDDANSLSIKVEESDDGRPISILTGLMDQAAVQGLLRRLYSLGLPLISVNYIDDI